MPSYSSSDLTAANIAAWEEEYGTYTLIPPPTWPVDVAPFDPRPDFCTAVDGVEYDVHQHALGRLDLSTGRFDGVPYCVAIRTVRS